MFMESESTIWEKGNLRQYSALFSTVAGLDLSESDAFAMMQLFDREEVREGKGKVGGERELTRIPSCLRMAWCHRATLYLWHAR